MNNSKKMLNKKILDDQISVDIEKKTEINNDANESLQKKNIVLNTSIKITVELGKTKMKIKDFLNFTTGNVLILDTLIEEPLNIFADDCLIASGELVFLEKKYGLRITKINNSLKSINSTV